MVCTTPPWSPLTLPLSLQGAVTYQLPSAGVTWSTVFRQLEGNKERLGIVDYSVSQTTLDQVRLLGQVCHQCWVFLHCM